MAQLAEKQCLGEETLKRSCHTAHYFNNSLWILGGEDIAEKACPSLIEYNLIDKTCSVHTQSHLNSPTLFRGRYGHSSVLIPSQNSIYSFGGECGPKYGGSSNELWKIDLTDKTFSKIKTNGIHPPQKRTKHGSILLEKENIVIVYGGWDGESTAYTDLFIIDLTEKEKIEEKEKEKENEGMEPFTWYKVTVKDLPERIWHSMDLLSFSRLIPTPTPPSLCVSRAKNKIKNRKGKGEKEEMICIEIIIACGEDKDIFLQNDMFIVQFESRAKHLFRSSIIDNKYWKSHKIENIPFKLIPRYGQSINVIPNYMGGDDGLKHVLIFGGYGGEMSVMGDYWLLSFS